jgi:hypothetical protein
VITSGVLTVHRQTAGTVTASGLAARLLTMACSVTAVNSHSSDPLTTPGLVAAYTMMTRVLRTTIHCPSAGVKTYRNVSALPRLPCSLHGTVMWLYTLLVHLTSVMLYSFKRAGSYVCHHEGVRRCASNHAVCTGQVPHTVHELTAAVQRGDCTMIL